MEKAFWEIPDKELEPGPNFSRGSGRIDDLGRRAKNFLKIQITDHEYLTGQKLGAWFIIATMTDIQLKRQPNIGKQAYEQLRQVFGPYDPILSAKRDLLLTHSGLINGGVPFTGHLGSLA